MESTNWTGLSNSTLLKLKWKDLGLNLEHSTVYPFLNEVVEELSAKGFLFAPEFFISDGWFVSLNYTAIAIPFYLLHPRLVLLEKDIMGKIEGDSPAKFRRLIRHELGHSLDHAYKLQKNKERVALFGSSNVNYPDSYRPQQFSKREFVQYLGQNYASSHPDEDWAETFATWFDDRIHWRLRYPEGVARQKLNFMNRLMNEIKIKNVVVGRSIKKADMLDANLTLGALYRARLNQEKKFYKFDLDMLSTILVGKEEKVKSLGRNDKIQLGTFISKKIDCPKDDVIQVLNNLEISLWRKGKKLKIESDKEQKILYNYFAQKLSLYIGKEKNNILM